MMRNKILYIVLIISVVYLVAVNFTNLRSYRNIPAKDLLQRDEQLSGQIDSMRQLAKGRRNQDACNWRRGRRT
jgi:hypothetical protein